MANILLVEDDMDLANLVRNWLAEEGHTIEVAGNGETALESLDRKKPDLVILDLVLPLIDGLTVCRMVRNMSTAIPILVLTGKNTIEDKEEGFGAGADDYLTKPFHLKELAARTIALLRRPPEEKILALQIDDVSIDLGAKRIHKGQNEIHLLPKEFKILEFLTRHQTKIVSAQFLYKSLWSSELPVNQDLVRTHIRRIRKKLDTPGSPSIITTVRSYGYRLKQ